MTKKQEKPDIPTETWGVSDWDKITDIISSYLACEKHLVRATKDVLQEKQLFYAELCDDVRSLRQNFTLWAFQAIKPTGEIWCSWKHLAEIDENLSEMLQRAVRYEDKSLLVDLIGIIDVHHTAVMRLLDVVRGKTIK